MFGINWVRSRVIDIKEIKDRLAYTEELFVKDRFGNEALRAQKELMFDILFAIAMGDHDASPVELARALFSLTDKECDHV